MRKTLLRSLIVGFAFGQIALSAASARVLDVVAPYLGNTAVDIQAYRVSAKIAQRPQQQISFVIDVDIRAVAETDEFELHFESAAMTVKRSRHPASGVNRGGPSRDAEIRLRRQERLVG